MLHTRTRAQMKRKLPSVSILRCYKHLKDELNKTPTGRESLPIYEKLVALPKCTNSARVADYLYAKLPANSPLHRIPKCELAQAYLPSGVCTHGMRTNNPAEVYNAMALTARTCETLYRSLLATVQLLQQRRENLTASLRKHESLVAEPPRVRDAYSKVRAKAATLAEP